MNITITNALGMSKTFEFTISNGYKLTVTQADGGNISATQKYGDVFEVAPGAVIYLNADPEPGMIIEEWSVEGVNTNPVVTIDNEDPNSASFVMINENVNVTAVFRPLKEGEKDIGFRIKSVTLENGVAFIDEANATVKIMLNKDGNKSKVKPIIEVTEGATISPASGEEVDFTKNGSDTVKYTVSRNGGSHKYTFTVQINKLEKGTGTQSDPFRIENVDDLIAFRDSVNAGASFEGYYVVQKADLDLSQFGDQWVPIGTAVANMSYGSNPGKAFMGTYDGQNHKILNMRYISEDTDMCKGFFGTQKNATVKNLVIDSSCYVKTAIYVGGVAGLAVNSTFENCVNGAEIYSTGKPVKGGSDVARSFAGGVCGKAESGCVFIRCSNSGRIACNETRSGFGYKGPRGTGGISGDGGTFIFCNNGGSISGGSKTGGISGSGTAIGCWNTGDVRGYYEFLTAFDISAATSCVGGIVGEGTAESCYNKGSVSDNWLGVGGIVGSGTANNCYNTGAVATE